MTKTLNICGVHKQIISAPKSFSKEIVKENVGSAYISTEMALLKVQNDIATLMDKGAAVGIFIYLLLCVVFNSQGHIAMGILYVEETSAHSTVNHQALASNYQLSNMKHLG